VSALAHVTWTSTCIRRWIYASTTAFGAFRGTAYIKIGSAFTAHRSGSACDSCVVPGAVSVGVGASLARGTLTGVFALGLASATSGACNLRAHASFC
jgi:hypothetical protein